MEKTSMKTLILTVIIMATPAVVFAGQNEISATFASYHTDRADYNESNPGLYFTRYTKKEALGGKPFLYCGAYDNSEYRMSVLGGGGLLWGDGFFKVSLLAGLVTGYDYSDVLPVIAGRVHFSKVYVAVIPDVYNDQVIFGLGLELVNF